jgi:hypothetical protein
MASSRDRQGDDSGSLSEDPLVQRLVPEPDKLPPSVRLLCGFLGRCSRDGFWRLYLTEELNEYVEFAEEDAVATEPQSSEKEGGTRIWIKSAANVVHTRVESRELRAEFLEGEITGGIVGTTPGAHVLLPYTRVYRAHASLFPMICDITVGAIRCGRYYPDSSVACRTFSCTIFCTEVACTNNWPCTYVFCGSGTGRAEYQPPPHIEQGET